MYILIHIFETPVFLDSVAKAKGDVILGKPTTGGFLFPNLEIVTVYRRSEHTEAVFLNFYRAQKSIPPAYVAWRAGTRTLFLLGFWPS
jgi:hypothetical protein